MNTSVCGAEVLGDLNYERQRCVGRTAWLQVERPSDMQRAAADRQIVTIQFEVLELRSAFGRILAEVKPVNGFGRWTVRLDRLDFGDSPDQTAN